MKYVDIALILSKGQLVDLILEIDDAVAHNNDEDVPQLRKLLKMLNKVAVKEFPETS